MNACDRKHCTQDGSYLRQVYPPEAPRGVRLHLCAVHLEEAKAAGLLTAPTLAPIVRQSTSVGGPYLRPPAPPPPPAPRPVVDLDAEEAAFKARQHKARVRNIPRDADLEGRAVEVAQRLGVTRSAVYYARQRRQAEEIRRRAHGRT